MKNSYIELERLILAWDAQQKNPLTSGQRTTLVEIGRRDEAGLKTKATDLVQLVRLGTGPTIHGQLLRLEGDGLIARATSDLDARAVDILLTRNGRDYLKALDNLVRSAVK